MNETIACPNCRRRLQLPESALGQDVRCPSCGQVFEATRDLPPPRPVPGPSPSPPPRAVTPRPFDTRDVAPSEEEDDYPSPGLRAHRGTLILSLGIGSLFLFCLPPGGIILACVTLWMANRDLDDMRRKRMDPAGKGRTEAGHWCAAGAITLSVLYFLFACLWGANFR